MRLSAPNVRIADVETCDFDLMSSYDTEAVLRTALPDRWHRYLASAVSRRMIAELGVERRYLTHVPGQVANPERLTAYDLARSAVTRLRARRPAALARLDAVIFVSTSNPNPCNSQAALLAGELGLAASCLDLKAGCSGGVLGLVQGALLIQAGCERVLVVMAETLSQLTPPEDLRMLLTVGDGAACVLLEQADGAGFLSMIHGSAPEFAHTMTVRTPFPPAAGDARYVFEFEETTAAAECLRARWRSLYRESLAAAGLERDELGHFFIHQTHRSQVDELVADLDLPPSRVPRVVGDYGNMGTPTFAVAMAQAFGRLAPGQKYGLQAVGGGLSWCSIIAVHANRRSTWGGI